MKATKQIDIYLTKKHNVRLIDVVQYDTGIQLVFTVKDFTIPSGTTATLYVQKPSGKFVYQENGITVSGNTVTINLENQAIAEHGKVPYQVSLKSGSDVITTFAGVMMVEKSLKDAGATESVTVIRAFDEAVSDHVAEFQTKAEQIVQACIATIPDDYSAMEAKVNELANAVKGYLSGAVVFSDDVSPVEHSPEVWVHGKNLLKPVNGAAWQCTTAIADDGKITLTNTDTSGVAFARVGTIKLKKGHTYVYSRFAPNNIMNVLMWHTGTTEESWYPVNGVPHTMENDAVVDVAVYMSDISTIGKTASIYIQIEESETANDYEPYIDPSTVTVKRCGKNLIPYPFYEATVTKNGITYTDNGDGSVTIDGTATEAAAMILGYSNLGESVSPPNNNSALNVEVTNGLYTFSGGAMYNANIQAVVLNIPKGVSVNRLRLYPQAEAGRCATTFENYKVATTHVPNADGTVSGMTSLSPCMTILTDTEGVIVECEYNRDTNKVIDKLINAITALGGTV